MILMSKGILTLYVDNELKLAAKAKLINLSNMFNNALKVEIDGVDKKKDDITVSLKAKLIKALGELEQANKKLAKQDKELYDKRRKDEGWRIQT